MSRWSERFEEHDLHSRLDDLSSRIGTLLESDDAETEDIVELQRLEQCADYLRRLVRSVDPVLVPLSALNNFQSHVNQAVGQVSTFVQNREIAQLVAANNSMDAALMLASNVPTLLADVDVEATSEALSSLRRLIGQHARYMTEEKGTLDQAFESSRSRVAELTAALEAEKTRIDGLAAGLQAQFSEAQERRSVSFEEAQSERAEESATALQESTEAFDGELENAAGKLEAKMKSLTAAGNEALEVLDGHKTKAQELVYVISNTGMVGGYQTTANSHRNGARLWSFAAAAGFAGLVGFAIYATNALAGEDLGWAMAGGRAFVALSFGVFGAYAAKQADRHVTSEKFHRSQELSLASIDPYLSSLSPEEQNEIKKELARRMFAPREEHSHQKRTKGTSSDSVSLALEIISDLLKK